MPRHHTFYPIIVLSLLIILAGNGFPALQEEKTPLVLDTITYYPPSFKEDVGRSFETMLFTRLSLYFSVYFSVSEGKRGGDKEPSPSMAVSLTKIGATISLDVTVKGRNGKKSPYSITGGNVGDIPRMLEELSVRLHSQLGRGERTASITQGKGRQVGREELRKRISKRISKFIKFLPKGEREYSATFGGGYYMFSGGDLRADGINEIVAVSEDEIAVKEIKGDTVETLHTHTLRGGEEVIYLASGDIDGSGGDEVVGTIFSGKGVTGFLLKYVGEKEGFVEKEFKNMIFRIWQDPKIGTRLLAQRIDDKGKPSGDIEVNMLVKMSLAKQRIISAPEGTSIINTVPIYHGGDYHFINFSEERLWEGKGRLKTVRVGGTIEDVRPTDMDKDGDQEILLFASRKGKSSYFDSLPMKRGFAVELYTIENGSLKREYSYVNEIDRAGGYFPSLYGNGAVRSFVVVSLKGNEFSPASIKWNVVTIK